MPSVTFKIKDPNQHLYGFVQESLSLEVKFRQPLRQDMDNLNQFRSPDQQIKHIYNNRGTEILPQYWHLLIMDDVTFLVSL